MPSLHSIIYCALVALGVSSGPQAPVTSGPCPLGSTSHFFPVTHRAGLVRPPPAAWLCPVLAAYAHYSLALLRWSSGVAAEMPPLTALWFWLLSPDLLMVTPLCLFLHSAYCSWKC